MKYLIDFHHGVTEEQIDQYLSEHGYTFLKEWDNFERIVLVESDVEPVKTDLVEYIVRDDHLEIRPQMAQTVSIDENHSTLNVPGLPNLVISTSDEKDWWKNYVLPEPDFDNPTVTISRKGQNVSVYVMDSGINADHSEFQGVNVTNIYTITENDFTDCAGHGTAVASVISGNSCGLTAAHIKNVKIFRSDRGTYQSEFISALDAILNDFNPNSFAVVNCSWSIPRNEYIESKFREMVLDGIFVIAASGNGGKPIDDVTPAAMDEAVTVGSYNSDLAPSDFSDYTGGSHISYTEDGVNHGELDGWAPGERIYSANYSNNGFDFAAGTSMACAVTSAVAAYNLTDYLDQNGERLKGYENYPITFHRFFIWQRPNLLDLSDPKYQYSKNYIATLMNEAKYETQGLADQVVTKCFAGLGAQNLSAVVNIYNTKEAVVLEDLPEWLWINKDGFLWANPPAGSNNDPVTGENYTTYSFDISITDKEDNTTTKNVKIYIIPQDINLDDLPDDHEIKVTLLTNCSWRTTPSCPGVGPPTAGCYSACPGWAPLCCQTDVFKDDECACSMFG